jgi:hypothetical protein
MPARRPPLPDLAAAESDYKHKQAAWLEATTARAGLVDADDKRQKAADEALLTARWLRDGALAHLLAAREAHYRAPSRRTK